MHFIALKTCDGTKKGKQAFYCRMLDVSFIAVYDIRVDDAESGSYRGCPGAPMVPPVIESDVTPLWGVKDCRDALA